MTQLSGGDLVIEDYYNLNNNGFGTLYRTPAQPPAGQPHFFSAFAADNPPIERTVGAGFSYPYTIPFTPRGGLYSLAPFTHGDDEAAPVGSNGQRVGKFTHPSAAPDGDLLVVWTPGPANDLNRPDADALLRRRSVCDAGGNVIHSPQELVLIKNDPAYNEAWPRAVVPYSRIHGVAEPAISPGCRTTAASMRSCRRARLSAWSAARACTSARAFPGQVTSWSNIVRRPRCVQYRRERPVEQLVHPGQRCRQVRQQRHLGRAHSRHGAEFAPQLRPAYRPQVHQPRRGTPAHSR